LVSVLTGEDQNPSALTCYAFLPDVTICIKLTK
jgi:hypothetical protein